MSAHERLRHHKAKIQYLACEDEILLLLSQGYSKRLLHEELTENGHISMAYITLCQFIRRTKKKMPAPPVAENKNNTPPVSSARQPPKIVKAPSDALQDPRTVDPSTLF